MAERVLTYGTFDCLHYGHIRLLERAKELGHFLIVGLSTDEFNQDKGKIARFDYERRHKDLEAISYVDRIIPEQSWEQKEYDINRFNVDLLVMGDDWSGEFDDLPCRTLYLPRTPDVSSTYIRRSDGRSNVQH